MCEYNPKISVALEITADLPSSEELQRWLGEPVRVRGDGSSFSCTLAVEAPDDVSTVPTRR